MHSPLCEREANTQLPVASLLALNVGDAVKRGGSAFYQWFSLGGN